MTKQKKITEQEFKDLYAVSTNKKLAELFGVTPHTIINTARRLNLTMKGKGNRLPKSKILR